MPWSQSNGLNIYYELAGEGPPLVLLHANPFDHTMWVYQIANFSRRFHIVAIDLRGYGRSDKPERPFAFLDMANDVVAVVRDLGIDQVALVGVSIGGGLALQITLEYPTLVRAMVLVGGEAGNPRLFTALADDYASNPIVEQRAEHMRSLISADYAHSPVGRYLIDAFLQSSPQLSAKSISQIFRARAKVNLTSHLAIVSTPTLVINGDSDISLESGRYTASQIPSALHRIVPAAGHICCLENPWIFDQLILEFLDANGDKAA
jgi:pimeloyl-ACP methyl ester carboxylesterase